MNNKRFHDILNLVISTQKINISGAGAYRRFEAAQ